MAVAAEMGIQTLHGLGIATGKGSGGLSAAAIEPAELIGVFSCQQISFQLIYRQHI
jgi:hypothetical protein